MNELVWRVHCHRVWRSTDLTDTWPALTCPDPACNRGDKGSFMPYHQTRRLIARGWPEQPRLGERLPLYSNS